MVANRTLFPPAAPGAVITSTINEGTDGKVALSKEASQVKRPRKTNDASENGNEGGGLIESEGENESESKSKSEDGRSANIRDDDDDDDSIKDADDSSNESITTINDEEESIASATATPVETLSPIATPAMDKPSKFVFGSAAKSLVTFNTLAKSETKADFGEIVKAEELESSVFGGVSQEPRGISSTSSTIATGEEHEVTKYHARGKLYEFEQGEWRERGIGMVKINEKQSNPDDARVIMRAEGVLRLLLNIRLFSGMKFEVITAPGAAGGKSVRFATISADDQSRKRLKTFLLRFKTDVDALAFADCLSAYCDDYDDEIDEIYDDTISKVQNERNTRQTEQEKEKETVGKT